MSTPLTCHFLIGLPGSGKSTLAQHLHRLIPHSHLVSTDAIRAQLYGDPSYQGHWPDIETQVIHQIQAALNQGHSAIYDATNAKRIWRMNLLSQIRADATQWIGWWLKTPPTQCHDWNQSRQRQVPATVIDKLAAHLKRFPPMAAEGFSHLYELNPSQIDDLEGYLAQKLQQISRDRTNRLNRTHHRKTTFHAYSALLDFDRLLALLQLLSQYPGLGHLHKTQPENLPALGIDPLTCSDSLTEIQTVMTHRWGTLYADTQALTQDLQWLEQAGFFSPSLVLTPLNVPLCPTLETATHAYSDVDSFCRLLTLIRFISQHPFSATNTTPSSGQQVALLHSLQANGLWLGETQDTLRKDIEKVLNPYSLLPSASMRRGYYLGTGIVDAATLQTIYQILHSQAKHLEDPLARDTLAILHERLNFAQLLSDTPYPVRAISNRPIFSLDSLPPAALAKQVGYLEQMIKQAQQLEICTFLGVGRFQSDPEQRQQVWPLQIVFHNIAWYLGYEIADGAEAGLFQYARLDRLYAGNPQTGKRALTTQLKALKRLNELTDKSFGVYLGKRAKAQQLFLSRDPKQRKQAVFTFELWMNDTIFQFISEGTQRFDRSSTRISKRPTSSQTAAYPSKPLSNSQDAIYPNRLKTTLPNWSIDDVDFLRWIVGFGGHVKVASPPSLAEKVQTIGQQITQTYQPNR
jgi:predicted kinase